MELNYSKIEDLKEVKCLKNRILQKEKTLSSPLIRDLSIVQIIYQIFTNELQKMGLTPNVMNVMQRKKFIFIILYLFSPAVLVGVKMKSGLRDAISNAVQVKSRSVISDNCSDVVFLYNHYQEFREDIKRLFNAVVKGLKEKGLINDG